MSGQSSQICLCLYSYLKTFFVNLGKSNCKPKKKVFFLNIPKTKIYINECFITGIGLKKLTTIQQNIQLQATFDAGI